MHQTWIIGTAPRLAECSGIGGSESCKAPGIERHATV